ncbi:PRC-barrel domain-containing protein [uncultured Devosia sp.]|uniref:PRC-barrel domain-containing protein n=1 Tax=uncultured Devosia sp. TaxID=211434 RepID=UPI002608F12A|nr:PRC-barrel domain-containing protein [uncultured Devosia sp.]
MSSLKPASVALATTILFAAATPLWAQPLRYEICTTGFSAYGILQGLPVYDRPGDEIGRTRDLLIDRDGTVLHLEINRGGVPPDAHYFSWADVEIGETWVRALGEGSAQPQEQDLPLVSSAELIGSLVRTSAEQGLAPFGVVDDLLIDINTIEAVIIRPNLGLGLADKYAVSFDYVALRDPDLVQPGFDLLFDDDEVRDIGAFQC